LLDLPGIIEGAKDGKGRGKQVIAGKLLVMWLFTLPRDSNVVQKAK